jgi:type I restriction enzyme S subunit
MIDLNPNYMKTVGRILAEHVPECEVWAFGSRVTWTAKDYSDLDVAIVGKERIPGETLAAVREAFEESDLPFRVDVLDWRAITPEFRKVIEAGYEVIQEQKKIHGMAGECRPVTLDDVLSFANGRTSPERADGHPYPVYDSNGIIGFASETNAPENTIVMGRVGSYCGSLYLSKQACWVTDNAIRATALDANDARFLFYLLGSLALNRWRAGSGQPLLNQTILGQIPASVPYPEQQRAIAHILGTLDDKIELNRRTNETLEAIARALFKSWFVDFDPVRAKAEGRQPTGMDAETAKLFGSEFVESELGKIPKGWLFQDLGDIATVVRGRSYTSDELRPSVTALLTLKSFRRGGGYRADGLKPYVGVYKPEQVVQPGELVVAFTDVTQAAEVIGKPAIVRVDPAYETLVASLDVGIIRPATRVSIEYLSYALLADDFQAHPYAHTNGSKVLHLHRDGVERYPLLLPPPAVMGSFTSYVRPMIAQQLRAETESRTLAALRDALLPRLLSGELSVRAGERIAEATA